MKRFWALFLPSVLMVAACGGSQAATTTNKSPIKIGYIVPLTGVYAGAGKDEENGWNLGIKDFGDKVAGRPVQTIFVDSGGNPDQALADARQLVQLQNIDMLEGPTLANEDAAVAPYIGPLGIPTDDVALCAAPQLAAYRKYKTAFASSGTCDGDGILAAQWAYKTMGYRHVTTVGMDYAFGWDMVGAFAVEFKSLGGTIDKAIWPPLSAADFSPYVSQIPASTQAVFVLAAGTAASRFLNAYSQYGLSGKIPLIGTNWLTDQSVLPSETPSAALGVDSAAHYCDGINTPQNQKFVSEYQQQYGAIPGYYSELGYNKAQRAIVALKTLNGVTSNKKKLFKTLIGTKIVAPRGPISISPVTDSPIENEYICKVESVNGVLRNVPVKTYPNFQPWGFLTESQWEAAFNTDTVARPNL